jgi:hypothetical protein
MEIECCTCQFTVETYVGWTDHLEGEEHQAKTYETFQAWSPEQTDRSIVLLNWKAVKSESDLTPQEIMYYFAGYGMISDFLIHPNHNFIISQFDER